MASLTVPGGQEFHFPRFFLKFRSIFLIFPQTLLIVFLNLVFQVGDSPTREGPGYATEPTLNRDGDRKLLKIYDSLMETLRTI